MAIKFEEIGTDKPKQAAKAEAREPKAEAAEIVKPDPRTAEKPKRKAR